MVGSLLIIFVFIQYWERLEKETCRWAGEYDNEFISTEKKEKIKKMVDKMINIFYK